MRLGQKDAPLLPRQLLEANTPMRAMSLTRRAVEKGFEKRPQALLHLPVGIKPHLPIGLIQKTHGKRAQKLPATRLVEDSTLQPCLENVQFCFRHRSLEPQEEPIVKVSRIVEPVFAKD
jgi:hypothetical protein